MVNFNDLLNSSKERFEKLSAEVAKLNDKQEFVDERFWKPTKDKAGNSLAIIRFLPGADNREFVRVWHNYFAGPGGWYVENSLYTLGQSDPVVEFNRKLWDLANDNKESPEWKQASNQNKRQKFISNIYVVHDEIEPKNDGKVFLYSYPKAIFGLIEAVLGEPKFKGDPHFDPFSVVDGANLRLKVFSEKKGDRVFPNYSLSTWEQPGPLASSHKEMEKIWKTAYPLGEFIDPKNFKTYDQLKARLEQVLDINSATVSNPTKATSQLLRNEIPFEQTHHASVDDSLTISTGDDDDKLFQSILD